MPKFMKSITGHKWHCVGKEEGDLLSSACKMLLDQEKLREGGRGWVMVTERLPPDGELCKLCQENKVALH